MHTPATGYWRPVYTPDKPTPPPPDPSHYPAGTIMRSHRGEYRIRRDDQCDGPYWGVPTDTELQAKGLAVGQDT